MESHHEPSQSSKGNFSPGASRKLHLSSVRVQPPERQKPENKLFAFTESMSTVIAQAESEWNQQDESKRIQRIHERLVRLSRSSKSLLAQNFKTLHSEWESTVEDFFSDSDSETDRSETTFDHNVLFKAMSEGSELDLQQFKITLPRAKVVLNPRVNSVRSLLSPSPQQSSERYRTKVKPVISIGNAVNEESSTGNSVNEVKGVGNLKDEDSIPEHVQPATDDPKSVKLTNCGENYWHLHDEAVIPAVHAFAMTPMIVQCIAESFGNAVQHCIGSSTAHSSDTNTDSHLFRISVQEFVDILLNTTLRSFLESSVGDSLMNVEKLAQRLSKAFAVDGKVDLLFVVMNLAVTVNSTTEGLVCTFMNLCGDDGVSAARLARVLHPHDYHIALRLQQGESFLEKELDQDRDGLVTLKEFVNAAKKNRYWLDQIVRSLPSTSALGFSGRKDLKELMMRSQLSWKRLVRLQSELQRQRGHLTVVEFGNILFPYIQNPAASDGLFIRRVFSHFSISRTDFQGDDTSGASKGKRSFSRGSLEQGNDMALNANGFVGSDRLILNANDFLLTLASHLRIKCENDTSPDTVAEMAKFCFCFFDVDGDFELSKEEVFRILYQDKPQQCEAMLECLELHESLRYSESAGMFSTIGYLECATKWPKLLDPFKFSGQSSTLT